MTTSGDGNPSDQDGDGARRRCLTLRATGVAETRAIAAIVAASARGGDIVLLAGDLGAGKTAFAQGFGAALGIDEPVTSPTFTLVRTYPVPSGHGEVRSFLHADVYRLDHLNEIVDLGLGQLVEDGGVALVEWGDLAAPVLGDDALLVRLVADEDDDQVRRLVVGAEGTRWEQRWSDLAASLAPWHVGAP